MFLGTHIVNLRNYYWSFKRKNMPENNLGTSSKGKPHKHWYDKTVNQILEDIKEFFFDLFDLRDGMDEKGTILNIVNNRRMRGANAVLLMCSIMVASLGLDLNSPAVIIGAMLISPLMSPILGIGLGVGINDRETLSSSLQHFMLAAIIALVTSYVYFRFITPFGDITDEISARTAPNLLDGLVAIFGGTAGVISTTRKDKSNAIPGVAIATALMPPVCVAGFGLANGRYDFFLKAFYLFFLNSFFIAVSTYTVIRILRFKYKEYPNQKEKRRNKIFIIIFSLLILYPALTILISTYNDLNEDQKIEAFLNKHFENDFTAIADWEPSKTDSIIYLDVQLIGQPVEASTIDSCEQILSQIIGKAVKITDFQSKEIPFDEIQRLKSEMGGFQGELSTKVANLEKLQTEREQRIIDLTNQVDSLQNKVVLAKIFSETRVLYPLIDQIGFAKDFQQTNFKQQGELPLLLLRWNPRKSAVGKKRDEPKIIEFMKIRANLDTLMVATY